MTSMMHNPAHPGEVLKEWLGDISVTEAAEKLGITRVSLSKIINGRAGISADMALRLADSLGTDPEFWIGLQTQFELWQCHQQPRPVVQKMYDVTRANASAA